MIDFTLFIIVVNPVLGVPKRGAPIKKLSSNKEHPEERPTAAELLTRFQNTAPQYP